MIWYSWILWEIVSLKRKREEREKSTYRSNEFFCLFLGSNLPLILGKNARGNERKQNWNRKVWQRKRQKQGIQNGKKTSIIKRHRCGKITSNIFDDSYQNVCTLSSNKNKSKYISEHQNEPAYTKGERTKWKKKKKFNIFIRTNIKPLQINRIEIIRERNQNTHTQPRGEEKIYHQNRQKIVKTQIPLNTS